MTNPLQAVTGTWVNTSTTPNASFGSLPTAGNQVIVQVIGYNVGSTATGVADNQGVGNNYVKINALQGYASQAVAELWWCSAIGATSGTFTVTATYGSSIHAQVRIMECNGLTALDQYGTFNTASGTPPTTITVTASAPNTNANDFVAAVISFGDIGTDPVLSHPPTTGYTDLGFNQGWGVLYVDNDAGYKNVTSIETSQAVWTNSAGAGVDVVAIIATFKGPGSPPPVNPQGPMPRQIYIMP